MNPNSNTALAESELSPKFSGRWLAGPTNAHWGIDLGEGSHLHTEVTDIVVNNDKVSDTESADTETDVAETVDSNFEDMKRQLTTDTCGGGNKPFSTNQTVF